MKPKVLFILTDDPRTSTRPAEAIRIAAGVQMWQMVEVNLYLRNTAVLALSEHTEELREGDSYGRYLANIADAGGQIYAQLGAPQRHESVSSALPFKEVNDQQLAALAASCDYVFRF